MKYPLMTARNGGDVIMLSREEKKNKVRVRIALPATLHIRPHLFLKSLPCKAVMGARQRGGSIFNKTKTFLFSTYCWSKWIPFLRVSLCFEDNLTSSLLKG